MDVVRLFLGTTMLVGAWHACGQSPADFTGRNVLPTAFYATMSVSIFLGAVVHFYVACFLLLVLVVLLLTALIA